MKNVLISHEPLLDELIPIRLKIFTLMIYGQFFITFCRIKELGEWSGSQISSNTAWKISFKVIDKRQLLCLISEKLLTFDNASAGQEIYTHVAASQERHHIRCWDDVLCTKVEIWWNNVNGIYETNWVWHTLNVCVTYERGTQMKTKS